jgi:hypothetical protein
MSMAVNPGRWTTTRAHRASSLPFGRPFGQQWTAAKPKNRSGAPSEGTASLSIPGYSRRFPQSAPARSRTWIGRIEEDGRQIGVGLKFGAGAAEIHAYYVAVSDAFAFLDRGETLPEELAATLNERYAKIRETLPREEDTTP